MLGEERVGRATMRKEFLGTAGAQDTGRQDSPRKAEGQGRGEPWGDFAGERSWVRAGPLQDLTGCSGVQIAALRKQAMSTVVASRMWNKGHCPDDQED